MQTANLSGCCCLNDSAHCSSLELPLASDCSDSKLQEVFLIQHRKGRKKKTLPVLLQKFKWAVCVNTDKIIWSEPNMLNQQAVCKAGSIAKLRRKQTADIDVSNSIRLIYWKYFPNCCCEAQRANPTQEGKEKSCPCLISSLNSFHPHKILLQKMISNTL